MRINISLSSDFGAFSTARESLARTIWHLRTVRSLASFLILSIPCVVFSKRKERRFGEGLLGDNYNRTAARGFRVRSGHGKSGKSMDFVFENSRPGNSMEVDEKFWKKVESFGKFLFRKGCFLFFRAGARSRLSRPACMPRPWRRMFDLTVSCHGQLVHFRSRRGRGPL